MKMKIDERYIQDIDDEDDDDLLDVNQKSANSITFTHWLKVSPRKLMAYPKFDYLKHLIRLLILLTRDCSSLSLIIYR